VCEWVRVSSYKNIKGMKKPKKVMKLEKHSKSNVADLKSENWITDDRVLIQAFISLPSIVSSSGTATGIYPHARI